MPWLFFLAGANELDAVLKSQKQSFQKAAYAGWTYYDISNCRIVHTGEGAMNAVCAASAFLEYCSPPFCLQLGFSGAHRSELNIEDLILGKKVTDFCRHTKTKTGSIEARSIPMQHEDDEELFSEYVTDSQLYARVKLVLKKHEEVFHEGVLGGADQFNKDPLFIEKIRNTYGTWCEDMESSAIAWAAHRRNTPHLSLRVISNNELSQSPAFTPECLHKLGRIGAQLILEL